jgi:hypothetical protein
MKEQQIRNTFVTLLEEDTTYENCTIAPVALKDSFSDVTFKNCTFQATVRPSYGVTFIDCYAFQAGIIAGFEEEGFEGPVNFVNCDLSKVQLLVGPNKNVKYDKDCFLPAFQIVPETGSFTAWKKVEDGFILKLLIPASAKRTSSVGGTRKCRASKAKVVSVYTVDGSPVNKQRKHFYSIFNRSFKYTLGKYVEEPKFNPDPQVECTKGIHFFLTKKEAEEYEM